MRRRELLRLLLVVAGVGPVAARAPGRRDRISGPLRLSAGDARLADLGERFAADDPVTARVLVDEAAARLRTHRDGLGSGFRCARATLLGAAARERDLARGDLVSIDGWLLTRSEVACCAYLHAVRGGSAWSDGARTQLG